MVEVEVNKLGQDSSNNAHVVILKEKDGPRLLPIWIGKSEADSILMEMQGQRPARPLTHDLCKRLITGLGGALRRVQITKVKENTYFAELHIHRGDDLIQVDARPSDSIAIALRLSAPIFAQESLLTAIAIEDASEGEDEEPDFGAAGTGASPSSASTSGGKTRGGSDRVEMTGEELQEHLKRMRPEDFGKFNP